jgi:adenylate cyclase
MKKAIATFGGRFLLKAPLHVNILAIFIALFVLLAGTLIWYNYHRNSKLALEAADTLLQTVNEKVLERTRNFISPPVALVEVSARLLELQAWGGDDGHHATAYFIKTLDTYPQLYGLFIGYGDGGFFQVVNFRDVSEATLRRLNAPAGTRYGIRKIQRVSPDRRVQTWTFLDAQKKRLGPDIESEATYDPRVRPWYKSTMGQDTVSMTSAYIFASLKAPGITVSKRMAGKTEAVLAADITLSRLSSFLRMQKVGKSGIVFIHNARNELIAFPDPDRAVKTIHADGKTQLRPLTVSELGIPALTEAMRRSNHTTQWRALYAVEGRDYIASIAPLTDSFGSDKRVAIVVPVDDFLGPIAEHRTRSLLFSLVPLLLAVPMIAWISQWISRPIRAIADDTTRIQSLSFGESPPVISPVTEIRQLANSVAAMKRTIQTFTQYVPKALVEQLIRSGNVQGLGGERRNLTILFTDVANFTDMAEEMSPEDLMRKTSGYFQALGEIILDNKGSIDKYIGDAIMAFWNAPLDDPDHVANACRTMLLCQARSRELNAQWTGTEDPPMHTRFGLHTGDTVVGNIGSPDRMDYTALGASVNLAARLEGLNKQYGTELLVSETVFQKANGTFLFRPIDTTTVKGFSQPVSVFELCAAYHGPDAITATRVQRVFCERWNDIHERITQGDWDAAYPLIRRFMGDYPEDRVAKLYAERCRRRIRETESAPAVPVRA